MGSGSIHDCLTDGHKLLAWMRADYGAKRKQGTYLPKLHNAEYRQLVKRWATSFASLLPSGDAVRFHNTQSNDPTAYHGENLEFAGVRKYLEALLAAADRFVPRPVQPYIPAATPAAAPATGNSEAYRRLLCVFSNGVYDQGIERAVAVLQNDELTTNDKLAKIDAIIPFPATASGEQLGKLLGVTKQAIYGTDWWIDNRKGEKANAIGRREGVHRERAKQQSRDDDE